MWFSSAEMGLLAMAELKPCNCRKSKKRKGRVCLVGPLSGYNRYFALCPWCGKCTDDYNTKQQAIDAWNRRAR